MYSAGIGSRFRNRDVPVECRENNLPGQCQFEYGKTALFIRITAWSEYFFPLVTHLQGKEHFGICRMNPTDAVSTTCVLPVCRKSREYGCLFWRYSVQGHQVILYGTRYVASYKCFKKRGFCRGTEDAEHSFVSEPGKKRFNIVAFEG